MILYIVHTADCSCGCVFKDAIDCLSAWSKICCKIVMSTSAGGSAFVPGPAVGR